MKYNLTLLVLSLACLAVVQSVDNPLSIVVGPIIGKVTTTTARILLEFNKDGTIILNLKDPSGQQKSVVRKFSASVPVVFAFDNLQPNTNYNVSLNDSSVSMTQSYFSTLSGESGKLNFAVLSCNDQYVQRSKKPEADLWADMLKRIENNEIQYLLQTGDQVYMDDPFGKMNLQKPYYAANKILNETSRDKWNDKRLEILELLRNEYRQTWSIPSIRDVLARIPSLTILDDHQVRDDWGYLPEDYDVNSSAYFYGTIARQAYYEYERQLREDIDFNNIMSYHEEFYYEVLNDIAFFFVEYRGVRSWDRPYDDIEKTQLGSNQTQLLQNALAPNNGTFANLSNFFLVSPLTVVLLIEDLVKIGFYSNNDAQESWSYTDQYKQEQAQLLATLRDWKVAKPGREVTILDGDVHMGGFTDITYKDKFAFLQFTTSSMASSAPSDATFAGFDLIKEAQSIKKPWDYEHHDWTNDFNYGLIRADKAKDAATVACYMVKASGSEKPKVIDSNGKVIQGGRWNSFKQALKGIFSRK